MHRKETKNDQQWSFLPINKKAGVLPEKDEGSLATGILIAVVGGLLASECIGSPRF